MTRICWPWAASKRSCSKRGAGDSLGAVEPFVAVEVDGLAALFREEIRQAPPMEAEVPKPPAPPVRYIEKLVSKPGHFPPQFVKIPVRKPGKSEP